MKCSRLLRDASKGCNNYSTGRTIKVFRSDNGGEYRSQAFHKSCHSKSINREYTPPHTPQRNGTEERRNCSLLEITRCLLLDKALLNHLWGEVVKAASIIPNLRSTKKNPNKTMNELFSHNKPFVTHLRIFGSSIFVHISKTSRTKLEPHSEICILLSFDEDVKAYHCYKPSTKKLFISQDVHIDEDNPTEEREATTGALYNNSLAELPVARGSSSTTLHLTPLPTPSPADS